MLKIFADPLININQQPLTRYNCHEHNQVNQKSMLISTIIALLISLNFIVSEADFNSKSQQEKDALIEIVITDIPVM